MHRDRRYGFFFLAFCILITTWASTGRAQYFTCNTITAGPDSLLARELAPPYPDDNLVVTVRCFVHVLRESDGSAGLDSTTVDSLLGVAQQDLVALGVELVGTGQLDLLSSSYYADPDSFATDIFNEARHADAIDIYLGPDIGPASGLAQGVPSTALLLCGNLQSYSALSHLLGHCLGLYDTSETTLGVEAPNGSNAATAGDLIADTSATPDLSGWVDAECTLASGFESEYPDYDPDLANPMSLGRMLCWGSFSEAQRGRVLLAVQSYAALTDAVTVSTPVYRNATVATGILGHGNLPLSPTNAAAFDFDGDGRKDILVSGRHDGGANNDLGYAGSCSGYTLAKVPQFDDATGDAFPVSGSRPRDGTPGLIAADYDNDGNIDVFAPNPEVGGNAGEHGHSQRLYHNSGTGFADVTSSAGLRATGSEKWDRTIGGAWGDYDGDGYVDLLTVVDIDSGTDDNLWGGSYLRLYHNVALSDTVRGFAVVPLAGVGLNSNNVGLRSVFWVDLDQDHDMDLITMQYTGSSAANATSRYYLNTGGQFSDVTTTLFPMLEANSFATGRFCAAPGDLDNDGDVDIAYNGSADRGWVRNDLDRVTGTSTLNVTWNYSHDSFHENGWPTMPQDLDVFDFDQDGLLDMVVPNRLHTDAWEAHRLLRNEPTNHHFTFVEGSGLGSTESFGMGAADFSLDGYTDLLLGTEIVSKNDSDGNPTRNYTRMFFKSEAAFQGVPTSHWVGIRLEDTDKSCNYRGIGATVIVTAGSYRQAQVVDGGSGRAGQHDLDLSYFLGAYSDSVDVEVIWPCGQTQYARVTPDAYHTISMTAPIVDDNSATMYLNFVLGEETLDWVFEWKTAMPGNNALDWVEFPSGIPGYSGISRLDASMQDVEVSVTAAVAGGTTVYTHRVTWIDRPCADELTAYYKVHSKVLNADDPSVRKTLHLYGCPQS